MSDISESIKRGCKDKIGEVILHFSAVETVRNLLQARVDSAIDQITSPAAINDRYIKESITLKRFFVGKIAKSETLKALMGATLVLVKYSSYLLHADLVPILDASRTFYESEIRPILDPSYDRDDSLKDFTKWMFIAVFLVGIPIVKSQGLLLGICAMLENIETRGGMVLKYPTGGGKTDAVKRRLLVYELMVGNTSEAQKYRAEVINSAAKKSDRKRAGNHELKLEFKPEDIVELQQWPEDNYAILRDRLSHHAHHTTSSPEQVIFFEAVHGMFADIPYFAAILHRPLGIYYDQLMVWKSIIPTKLTQLPPETIVLQSHFVDADGVELDFPRNIKNQLRMAMITVPPDEFEGHDKTAAIQQEWQWMFNYAYIADLIHTTDTNAGSKANQEVYFEVTQRFEGSGRSYTKGGDRKASTERRLVIIEQIRNRPRRSKNAVIPVAERDGPNNVVEAFTAVPISPPLPSHDDQGWSLDMGIGRVFDKIVEQ